MSDESQKQYSSISSAHEPKTLINVFSRIQDLYLIEKAGNADKEVVTVERLSVLTIIGVKSALLDTIIWILFDFICILVFFWLSKYIVTDTTTAFLFFRFPGHPLLWFLYIASYGRILFSTGLCVGMAYYYIHTATKRAIRAVLFPRMAYMIALPVLTFLGFGLTVKKIFNYENLESVQWFSNHLPNVHGQIYEFFVFAQRKAFESSMEIIAVSMLSVILTSISLVVFWLLNKEEKELTF